MIRVHVGVTQVQGQAAAIIERLGDAAKNNALEALFEHAVPILARHLAADTVRKAFAQLASSLAAERDTPLAIQIEAERAALAAIRQARDIVDDAAGAGRTVEHRGRPLEH